jgi:hypothetical protein
MAEVLPFADALGGLFFNPAYLAELGGEPVLRMKKERSFFESRFRLERLGDFSEDEEELLLASFMIVLLLERDRGETRSFRRPRVRSNLRPRSSPDTPES